MLGLKDILRHKTDNSEFFFKEKVTFFYEKMTKYYLVLREKTDNKIIFSGKAVGRNIGISGVIRFGCS
jgi:hypothetical protein